MPRCRGRFAGRGSAARGGGRVGHPPGRWSLTAPLFGWPGSAGSWRQGWPGRDQRLRAQAELLLERYGILTRELVRAEGVPGGFAALYPELCRLETLGVARRGYFVEGMGGAQFALAGAVERLRAQREDGDHHPACLVLAATDPAQPYGAALPWPGQRRCAGNAPTVSAGGRRARAWCWWMRSRCSTWSAGAEALRVLAQPGAEDTRVEQALAALAEQARAGRLPARIALERVDGEPVLGSRWEAALERAGFRVGPRRVELAGR